MNIVTFLRHEAVVYPLLYPTFVLIFYDSIGIKHFKVAVFTPLFK